MLEKALESPLDFREIQPVHPKGDQSWVFFGSTDVEAEIPILWPPHAKNRLIGKDPDAGKDWGQEEKGTTEDEMAGWHHWLDGRESEWTPGDGDGQGGLACCDSRGRKESDTTEWLNWTVPGETPNTQRFVFHYFFPVPSIHRTRPNSSPLGWEDPLEKEMAIHSSLLAWETLWRSSLLDCGPWDHKELNMAEHTCTMRNPNLVW